MLANVEDVLPLEFIPSVYVSTSRRAVAQADLQPLDDPLKAACSYVAQGASVVQLFDLDDDISSEAGLALTSQCANAGVLPLVWGGVTTAERAHLSLAAGAHQVVVPLAAWRQWERHEVDLEVRQRLILGLDVREADVVDAQGQRIDNLDDVAASLDELGVARVIVRCLASDGRLTGPNYELLGRMCARTSAKVIASGGISSIEDLRRLRGLVPIGVEGAVVGRALGSGVMTVAQARQVTAGDVPLGPSIEGEIL